MGRYKKDGTFIPNNKKVEKEVSKVIDQEKFFEGLDFEKVDLLGHTLYKGVEGTFFRIDQSNEGFIAIEYADSEDYVRCNFFDDADLFDITGSDEEMLQLVRSELERHYSRSAPEPL